MPPLNVRDLLLRRLGVPVTMRRSPQATSVSNTSTEVARGNPARVGLQLINSGTFVVNVFPLRALVAPFGFRLEPNGGALLLNWEQDGEIVAWPWAGIAVGGVSDVLAVEEIIDSGPEDEASGSEGRP